MFGEWRASLIVKTRLRRCWLNFLTRMLVCLDFKIVGKSQFRVIASCKYQSIPCWVMIITLEDIFVILYCSWQFLSSYQLHAPRRPTWTRWAIWAYHRASEIIITACNLRFFIKRWFYVFFHTHSKTLRALMFTKLQYWGSNESSILNHVCSTTLSLFMIIFMFGFWI